MRLPPSPGAGGPGWEQFRQGIVGLFGQQMQRPFLLWPCATADLPTAADFSGGFLFDPTTGLVAYSDGTAWNEIYGAGTDAADARANMGLTAIAIQNYTEGNFTPVLKFGGGTTGITYGTQLGRYTRIGRKVFIEIDFTLTAKGSSTGAAVIDGLPYTSNASLPAGGYALSNAMSGVTLAVWGVNTNATTIALSDNAAGTLTALNDTNFTNTSRIVFSGSYTV